MKRIFFMLSLLSVGFCSSCVKRGCTDVNADNYDALAKKSDNCMYRYVSTIDISNVPTNKPNGDSWDLLDGPDLKIRYGRSTSTGYDYSTNTSDNSTTATLSTATNIQFSKENWKYELIDDDGSSSDVIATGIFNPLSSGSNGNITLTSGTVTIVFHYTVQ